VWRSSRAARGPYEQHLAVGKCDIAAVGPHRAVLGLIAHNDDLCSLRERMLGPAPAYQRIGRAAFNHPTGDRAVRAFYVQMNPDVRVDPFDLSHPAPQVYLLMNVHF